MLISSVLLLCTLPCVQSFLVRKALCFTIQNYVKIDYKNERRWILLLLLE